jgi:hypothetical protein
MAKESPALGKKVEIAGPRGGATIEEMMNKIRNKLKKDMKKVDSQQKSKKKGQVIEGLDFNFGSKKKGSKRSKMLQVQPGHDGVVIKRCWFHNKPNNDPALVIRYSKNVIVQDCVFENMEGGDGREAIRIAENGRESGVPLNCKIKNCIFKNNSGDDEVISIKSANNTIEDCFFIDNGSDDDDDVSGNLTVRNGGGTIIRHNYFKGKNGVRIYGYGNRVEYNCFVDNPSESKQRSPISLWSGNKDKDENWKWTKKNGKKVAEPKGKKGKRTVGYAQAVDTVIRKNEFKGCRNRIVEVKTKKTSREPIGTKQENNEGVEKFTFEK